MRIVVNEAKNKVSGYCSHPSWSGEDLVIGFNKIFGEWSVGTSRCLPSDLESAKIILECMNKTFDKVLEIQNEENKYFKQYHLHYVQNLKKDDVVTLWYNITSKEVLHFAFIDYNAGVPCVYCYPNGQSSKTYKGGEFESASCLEYNNEIVDLSPMLEHLKVKFKAMTCKEKLEKMKSN